MTKPAKLSAGNAPATNFSHAWQPYFFALRPMFLSLTLVSCLSILGLAVAVDFVGFDWVAMVLGTLAALCLHAAANVLNDVADDDNGTDKFNETAIYPFTGGSRLIQSGWLLRGQMLRLARAVLVLAMILGGLLWWRVGVVVLVFGVLGVFFAWAYSLPPLRLNSRGLGEPCVAVSFGLLPVGLAWVSFGQMMLPTWFMAGISGTLTMALLHLNQFPDCAADLRAGKRHWVARVAVQTSVKMHGFILLLAFALLACACVLGVFPSSLWLGFLVLPLSLFSLRELDRYADQPHQLRRGIIASIWSAHLMPLMFAVLYGV